MKTFQGDYKFGTEKENQIHQIITNYFKEDILKSESSTSKYDFYSSKHYYELKSRNNTYKAFPTTLIGVNKVFDINHIFLFCFKDGLYFIKYDKELFDGFDCKPFKRNPRKDYVDKEQMYYFIPIDFLTKIN
jgi:hypothetical protein